MTLPHLISIRPEKPEDFAAIYEVNIDAFGQANEARLVDDLRKSSAFVPELSLVACEDDRIVGHILFSRITIEKENRSFSALSLAPMAVSPGFQRQGIGSQLVREGLRRARSLGHRVVVVVGHPNYYPRFGFSSARAKGLEAPFSVPDEAFLVLELSDGALHDVSGIVKYPSAFDNV